VTSLLFVCWVNVLFFGSIVCIRPSDFASAAAAASASPAAPGKAQARGGWEGIGESSTCASAIRIIGSAFFAIEGLCVAANCVCVSHFATLSLFTLRLPLGAAFASTF